MGWGWSWRFRGHRKGRGGLGVLGAAKGGGVILAKGHIFRPPNHRVEGQLRRGSYGVMVQAQQKDMGGVAGSGVGVQWWF